MTAEATHDAIMATWKRESARIVAGLARIVRDVSLAEEIAQDALVLALESWPKAGVPDRPGAWLMTAGKNRALNVVRRDEMAAHKHEALGRAIDDDVASRDPAAEIEAAMEDHVGDDVLRLVFIACHPALSKEARVALTLRLIGGLTTDEIARAFLAPEPTIAQRIVRAKHTLREARVPFELPEPEALGERLSSVLEVVYLIFNEGYAATAGDDLMRPALVDEALRLGVLLADLAPREAEVWSLSALMHVHASRAAARTDDKGDPILLMDQDRTRWDSKRIARGLEDLARAAALSQPAGPYRLQAEIAACHARARAAEETAWARIAALYADLARVAPSPVIELNRAIAISRAEGPAAGLALLDVIAREPRMARYHLLPSARADLLAQLGRNAEARAELLRAAQLTDNARLRERLRARAAALAALAP